MSGKSMRWYCRRFTIQCPVKVPYENVRITNTYVSVVI